MLPVVVLAGGLATRLRPVTETVPKALIPVNGVPFVFHQLNLLKKNGFTDIHFCLGYLGHMIEEVVVNSRFAETLAITFSYDGDTLLGTGGAIRKILHQLPDYFFVTYGDSYLDIDYKNVQSFFEKNTKNAKTALMTVFKNEGKWDTSNVIFENNRVVMYSKRIKDNRMQYIDYGLGILTKNDFDGYQEECIFDLADIYETLSTNDNLLGLEMDHRFFEIGSFTGIGDISDYLKRMQ